MSGALYWYSGNLLDRGTYGNFWASTLNSYANLQRLGFGSSYVNPKNYSNKLLGYTLRCVAQPSKLNTLSLPNRPLMAQHGGYDRVLGA